MHLGNLSLDFVEDIAQLTHTLTTSNLEKAAAKVGLSVGKGKLRPMRINSSNINPIGLAKRAIDFLFLVGTVSTSGRTVRIDDKGEIRRTRAALNILYKVWVS